MGIIQEVNDSKVTILYDNGVEQDYSHNALYTDETIKKVYKECGMSTGYIDFDSPNDLYIRVTTSKGGGVTESKQSGYKRKPLPQKCYLIVNMSTGEVVGTETDEDEAETFAYEQAMDSKTREIFTVFAPRTRFAIKQPLVEKIKDIFTK